MIPPGYFCLFVYYESIKRELKIKSIYECRCDERLQTKTRKLRASDTLGWPKTKEGANARSVISIWSVGPLGWMCQVSKIALSTVFIIWPRNQNPEGNTEFLIKRLTTLLNTWPCLRAVVVPTQDQTGITIHSSATTLWRTWQRCMSHDTAHTSVPRWRHSRVRLLGSTKGGPRKESMWVVLSTMFPCLKPMLLFNINRESES